MTDGLDDVIRMMEEEEEEEGPTLAEMSTDTSSLGGGKFKIQICEAATVLAGGA